MKYLGIDYGSKRVGVALSDDGGSLAFPKTVLAAGNGLLEEIQKLCREEGVGGIVIGESRDYKGAPNPIMKEVAAFKAELETATGLQVVYEPEFMTSAAAEHIQGKTAKHDASAAALILQSFLDKQKNHR